MLRSLVAGAQSGTTILLADGTYPVPANGIVFSTPGVTVRSESGNPSAVILDGQYTTAEVVRVTASDSTLAEVTVTRAVDHPVHVYPGGAQDLARVRLYRVRFIDGGEQFLKVNSNGAGAWPDEGTVECSHFELTDQGRPQVERATGGCYTGGIDVHGGRGWVVRRNTFTGIYCAGEGLAEHAIHFWQGARDTLVEQNVIKNCARGIGFGLSGGNSMTRTYTPDPDPGVTGVQHYGGIIRNNVVWADNDWHDTGIGLEASRGTVVLHNTVVSTAGTSFFSSIDARFAQTQATVRNNLARRLTVRDGATATQDHNLAATPASLFESFGAADLRLVASAAQAIDQGVVDANAGLDLEGQPRDAGLPDLGAFERR